MATPHERLIDRGHGRLRERFYSADSYGLVLVLIFSVFVIMVLSGLLRPIVFVSYPLLLVVMLLSLRTSRVSSKTVRLAMVIAVASMPVGLVAYAVGGDDPAQAIVGAISAALAAASIIAIIGRLTKHAYIAVETVLGALCIYLLAGLLFGFVYMSSDAGGSSDFFAQGEPSSTWEYFYFSYVTLATLGYGDLSPAQLPGQALAILEVLMGQLYLVTVVAAIVGNLLTSRQRGVERGAVATGMDLPDRLMSDPGVTDPAVTDAARRPQDQPGPASAGD